MSRVASGDAELSPDTLEACRRGDRDALRELYDTYKDRVYTIAFYFFHGDAAAASDVSQQVFLKLLGGMATYRGDSAFSTWLYRLVVNACVDRSRRRKAEGVATDASVLDRVADPASSTEDLFARGEVAHSVRDAIATLPPKLRMAILMRYFDDLSYTDMAAALNCSIGTVSSRLSRGHRLLARRLAPLRGALLEE
jgi:RNA polymerase sigma-70 factor (ECF subfamily)